MRIYAAVGLGSGIGSIARYLCSLGMIALLGPLFPWGTLVVNALGSFLMGLYATLAEPDGRIRPSPAARHFVLAGFCGGFTTFSIFSLETLLLVEREVYGLAGLYVATSICLWLIAVWLGFRIGVMRNRLKMR